MAALDLEVRSHLADYLWGTMTLEAFRQWFGLQAWNIEKRAGSVTASLVREIELLLAEFDHGDWSEEEIKEMLRPFVTTYSFAIGHQVRMSSESEIMEFQVGHRSLSVGTRRVVEFA